MFKFVQLKLRFTQSEGKIINFLFKKPVLFLKVFHHLFFLFSIVFWVYLSLVLFSLKMIFFLHFIWTIWPIINITGEIIDVSFWMVIFYVFMTFLVLRSHRTFGNLNIWIFLFRICFSKIIIIFFLISTIIEIHIIQFSHDVKTFVRLVHIVWSFWHFIFCLFM